MVRGLGGGAVDCLLGQLASNVLLVQDGQHIVAIGAFVREDDDFDETIGRITERTGRGNALPLSPARPNIRHTAPHDGRHRA